MPSPFSHLLPPCVRGLQSFQLASSLKRTQIYVGDARYLYVIQRKASNNVRASGCALKISIAKIACFAIQLDAQFGAAPGVCKLDMHIVAVNRFFEQLNGLLGPQACLYWMQASTQALHQALLGRLNRLW